MSVLYAKVCDVKNVCVIGDIHSSPTQLNDIITQAYAKGIYQFILLGDLWDRGVDPNGVIDILERLDQKGQLHSLIMGNHCWKFYRYFNEDPSQPHRIKLNPEQVITMEKLNSDTPDRFLNLVRSHRYACVVDYKNRLMFSHAAGGRPQRICEKIRNDATIGTDPIDVNEFFSNREGRLIPLNRNIADRMLFGIIHKDDQIPNQRPVRKGITNHPDDELDGWRYFYGHIHANAYYPEEGNKQAVCLDFCCGEPDGYLAAALIKTKDDYEFITSSEKT